VGENLKEKCGVFGVYAPGEDVARLTFYGLYALQHRGQESAGISTTDGHRIFCHTDMGLVAQVFTEEDLSVLPGHAAIGHTRYSTTGSSAACNAQPIQVRGELAEVALAHNGNLTNTEILREQMERDGASFTTDTDSEAIALLIAGATGATWKERFHDVMRRLEGAYSLTILTKEALFAVRDPMGNRPLCMGRLDKGWVVASESCALDHLGAQFVREIEPGEVVQIDGNGVSSYFPLEGEHRKAFCIFENIYFARPDSVINGKLLYPMRMAMGAELAREHPVDADIVIGVPDSATAAAIGYARESGIPYADGLVKNRYVGRTFIQPDQRIREAGVSLKFNPLPEVLSGQRVVVVDDSIVRGTTTPHVVNLLRRAGAREVHMRITSPPITHPCFFGVDMATRWELIAARKTIEEIREHIEADSLGYLSREGLLKATNLPESIFCLACFTGEYPVSVQLQLGKLDLKEPVGVGAGAGEDD
jgi:amidophosphoribosyltransferase